MFLSFWRWVEKFFFDFRLSIYPSSKTLGVDMHGDLDGGICRGVIRGVLSL